MAQHYSELLVKSGDDCAAELAENRAFQLSTVDTESCQSQCTKHVKGTNVLTVNMSMTFHFGSQLQ